MYLRAPDIGALRASKYVHQMLTDLKGDIDNNTKRTHGYDTPLPIMDRSPRQKSKKEMSNLNYALD